MVGAVDRRFAAGIEPDLIVLNDWHVVALSDDLPVGGVISARLLETNLVVWRGDDGRVQVWHDRCPHRSVRLSGGKVVNNALVCPYHGLAYSPEGRCVNVPAHPGYVPPPQACAQTFMAQDRYGLIYVCLGEPAHELPTPGEWDDRSFRRYINGPYAIPTNGLRAIENFLDVAHLAFIHPGVLGDAAQPDIPDYRVDVSDDGVHAYDVKVWQPDPYGNGAGGAYIGYDYWVMRPFTAYLRKEDPDGKCKTILFHVTPLSETEAIGWMILSLNFAHDTPATEVKAHQDRIFSQDTDTLASHDPVRLPLVGSAEFHLPSDRTSMVYRTWLKRLGLTYGVL
ncbi:aromatic ring-hydroxylating dioxygenase subunit alpha [Leptolyngbya sp. FACHB-36]|uniref:aromatic ring-hydroxylating oxygenase subunit alpha n=1 Tax=Leptolyngbya sp. FACHB-36 TaxID=2692808 RepID=UPI001680D145|nr:aromatic ring-hydroxylating dioxygenase subunit alpha [Leptolyngbya sp. FACHB-36]MBD2018726.1 aromatic ring-hydroxylating dioxygenase subunit alpha [Leptolyngbya sp. FACHB-36]